eukprot:TRINITY_DN4929_c0_g1_i2.p1 TRINITY_DN4929_c0_g1~~TRINITY_DN4929_c0_g1_i2.p1  ORF type:complete len:150 (+),score=29.56 TRINITY_DN4929_c0_g1_i2:135-584(+)
MSQQMQHLSGDNPQEDEAIDDFYENDEYAEESSIPFAMSNNALTNSFQSAAARGGLEAWIKQREERMGVTDDDPDWQRKRETKFSAILFISGWFCFFPWLFGAKYIKSRHFMPRMYGIASLVFAVAIFFLASSLLLHLRLQHIRKHGPS